METINPQAVFDRLEALKLVTEEFVTSMSVAVAKVDCMFLVEMVRDTFNRYNEICVENAIPLGVTGLNMCLHFNGKALSVMFSDRYHSLQIGEGNERVIDPAMKQVEHEKVMTEYFTSVNVRALTSEDPAPLQREHGLTWDAISAQCGARSEIDKRSGGIIDSISGSPYEMLSVLITTWFMEFSDTVTYDVGTITDAQGRQFLRICFSNDAGVVEIRHNWESLQRNYVQLNDRVALHEAKAQGHKLH